MKALVHKILNYKFRGLDYYLMRGLSNKSLRDSVIKWKVKGRGKEYSSNKESAFMNLSEIGTHSENLRANGFTKMNAKVSESKQERILESIKLLSCFDPHKRLLGEIDPLNPPNETHTAHYRRDELVQNIDILEIANDPGILSIAQDFLGATPTISNVNLWWSYSGKKQAEEAQLYHRDVDDWKFCKLFIYLTDVSKDAGPHIYVKGSSLSPKLRKIRRYQDQEVEKVFGKENVMTFIEPKGSVFLVDTYGFHKGLLPNSEKRLLLQVEYSLNPLAVETYKPVSFDSAQVDQLNLFVNRLLIK